MKHFFPALFVASVSVALLSSPASAQQYGQPDQRPERPYRGVYAGGVPADAEQVLSVNGSVGTGFDTSVIANAAESGPGGGAVGPGASRAPSYEGGYAVFSEGLSYALNKTRASLGASASASAHYYPTLNDSWVSNYGGSFGAGWSPSRRSRLTASQSFSYQPFNFFSLFPEFQEAPLGQTSVPNLDYATLDENYYTYSSQVGFTRNLSSRATFAATYDYTRSDFTSRYPDYSSQMGSARFTRSLNAGLALRLGYGYTQANYSDGQRPVGRHLLDTGIDFNRTLSFSRRTRLSFSTGATATKDQSVIHYNIVGNAHLDHEIGRTWNFNAAYDRNIGFIETFSSPILYDSVHIGLQGLIGRSVSFNSGGGASFGHVGFSSGGDANDFDTYYASAGIGRALNRNLSLNLDYSFYRYNFNQFSLLPRGYNDDLNRHSIRASLNAWLPILQRGRRR